MKKYLLTALFFVLILALIGCDYGGNEIPKVESYENYYTVTFDYNDGSGRTESIRVKEGNSYEGLEPYEFSEHYEIIGWSLSPNNQVENLLTAIYSDTTLYAMWERYEMITYSEKVFQDVLKMKFAEFAPESTDPNALSGKELRIGSTVKHLVLTGSGVIYDNFSILVLDRSTDLYITFNNFCYNSHKSVALGAQKMQGSYTVTINAHGENNLIQCSGTNSDERRGGDCIVLPNIAMVGNGILALASGDGSSAANRPQAQQGHDGENGLNGYNGGYGINTMSMTIEDMTLYIVTGNGGRGGNGGDGNSSFSHLSDGGRGGNGGNGGIAIKTNTFSATDAYIYIKTGDGGNGGSGGKSGASGRGGNGGSGGNGGNGFNIYLSDAVWKDTYTEFLAGKYGYGGESGSSIYDAGSKGSNGAEGTSNMP